MSSVKEQIHELERAMMALPEEERDIFLECEAVMANLTKTHGYPAHLALIYVDLMIKAESEEWQACMAMDADANTSSPERLQ
jgi:hypothetical protein